MKKCLLKIFMNSLLGFLYIYQYREMVPALYCGNYTYVINVVIRSKVEVGLYSFILFLFFIMSGSSMLNIKLNLILPIKSTNMFKKKMIPALWIYCLGSWTNEQGLFSVVRIFGLLYSIEGKHLEPYGMAQCLISTSWECFCFLLVCWQCPLWPKCVDLSFGVPHPPSNMLLYSTLGLMEQVLLIQSISSYINFINLISSRRYINWIFYPQLHNPSAFD